MEYRADFFQEEKEVSLRKEYAYIISGGFYDVYVDYDGNYHMASEDKESLLARFDFYQKFQDKPYPSFCESDSNNAKENSLISKYIQIIGLPQSMLLKKVNLDDKETGETIIKSKEEIMDSITFHEELNFDDGRRDSENFATFSDDDFFARNDLYMLHAINYVISKGFYIINPERITRPISDPINFAPVMIDIKRLPEKYIQEEETVDKLIVDFVLNPEYSTETYMNRCKPVDQMTLEEKFQIAFNEYSPLKIDLKIRNALRRYFLNIARDLFNEFFIKAGLKKKPAGLSVLDHDMNLATPYSYVYFGVHFNGYRKRKRYLYNDDGTIRQQVVPEEPVYFDEKDKERIRVAYTSVKQYYVRHPYLPYIPAIFLKHMGLPSILLETFEYFDFENADYTDFEKLLHFEKNIDINRTNYLQVFADGHGNIKFLTTEEADDKIYFLLTHSEKEGLFISDPLYLRINSDHTIIAIDYKKATSSRSIFRKLIDGDYKTFIEACALLDKTSNTHYDKDITAVIKTFLFKHSSNTNIEVFETYFKLLSKGYSLTEAYDHVFGSSKELSIQALIKLIYIGFIYVFESSKKALKDHFIFRMDETISYFSQEEVIYDPYLKYPYIHKGLFFCGYSETLDSPIYFDKEDAEKIQYFYKLLFDRNFTYDIGFLNLPSLNFCITDNLNLQLGLPLSCDTVSVDSATGKLVFSNTAKDISLFDREDHLSLIKEDDVLSGLMVEHALLEDGLMVGNGLYGRTSLLYEVQNLSLDLLLFLSVENIQLELVRLLDSLPPYITQEMLLLFKNKKKFNEIFVTGLTSYSPNFDINPPLLIGKTILLNSFHEHIENQYRKLCLDDESPLIDLNNIYFEDMMVFPGYMIYAYMTEERKVIDVSKEDFKLLNRLYQASLYLTSNITNKEYRSYKAAILTGTPLSMGASIATVIKENNFIYNDSFKYPFREGQMETFPYDKYPSLDTHKRLDTKFKQMTTGTVEFRHQLLKDGFYMYYNSDFSDIFPSFELDENNEPICSSDSRFCYVFPDCTGVVKEVFLPDQLLFHTMLDNFLTSSVVKSRFPDMAFELQQFVEQVYLVHPDFLLKARNALALSQDKLKDYLRRLAKKHESPALDVVSHQNSLFLLVVSFLYYLDNLLIIKIKKEL